MIVSLFYQRHYIRNVQYDRDAKSVVGYGYVTLTLGLRDTEAWVTGGRCVLELSIFYYYYIKLRIVMSLNHTHLIKTQHSNPMPYSLVFQKLSCPPSPFIPIPLIV